jgi:hypothetical protein
MCFHEEPPKTHLQTLSHWELSFKIQLGRGQNIQSFTHLNSASLRAGGAAQVEECLPSKCDVLSSNPYCQIKKH